MKRRAVIGGGDVANPMLLGDIYPNPFLSAATIPFTLLQSGYVKLEIYNERRKLVHTVTDKIMDAGDYRAVVIREVTSLTPGTYYYQLKLENIQGSYTQWKRMLVS